MVVEAFPNEDVKVATRDKPSIKAFAFVEALASEDILGVEVASGLTCFEVAEMAVAKDELGFEPAAAKDERGVFA